MNTITSTAVQQASVCAPIKPEWLRIHDAIRVSGIGRSTIYSAIKEGRIKSVSLRQRNNVRGIRLISADSLTAYIESFLSEKGEA